MNDQIMNKEVNNGEHYVSFTFHNCNEINRQITFEIGVMRPLTNQWWDKCLYYAMSHGPWYHEMERGQFRLHSEDVIRVMNKDRPNSVQWRGHVDCCTINPRGYNRLDSAIVHRVNWSMPPSGQFTEQENLGCQYIAESPTGREEAGLFLDMNAGTLSYYRSGIHVRDIASGLQGDYVWVVYMKGGEGIKPGNYMSFECRAF